MTRELFYIGILFAFLFGISVGSFLNVVIYRLPNNMSVNFPPSHCPNCKHKLGPMDLFPLFSYLLLGRKCRYCSDPISPRYFTIELITGLLFVATFFVFGYTFNTIIYCLFIACMICVFMIDFDSYIIPFSLIIFGVCLGIAKDLINIIIAGQYVVGGIDPYNHIKIPFTDFSFPMLPSIVGIVGCGVIFILLTLVATFIFRREAMGGGDTLLACVIGSVLGFEHAIAAFMIAIFTGAIIGVFENLIRRKHNDENAKEGMIPFGPYLVFGAFISLFFFKYILNLWYWWLNLAFPPPSI